MKIVSLVLISMLSGGSVMAQEAPGALGLLKSANGAVELKLDMPAPSALVTEAGAARGNRNEICIGDTVIDDVGDIGTVKLVFANGMAQVYFPRYNVTYNKHVSILSKHTECYGGICVGAFVMDDVEDTGTVKKLFTNGTAQVHFPKYNTTYNKNVSILSKHTECYGGICVGAFVMDDVEDTGTVKKLFTNGIAQVYFPRYNTTYNKHVSKLSCAGGACCAQ